ncbi:MAG: hypothetical protein GY862_34475 [Gammaproteobacteria bacterium]|nr:hypothetical protein [Gammaproteobacteria bacterium]
MTELMDQITAAQLASCNCDLKTNETKYHMSSCRYRVLEECRVEIERLRLIEGAAHDVAIYHDASKTHEMDNGEAGIVLEWEPVWQLHNALNPPASPERHTPNGESK